MLREGGSWRSYMIFNTFRGEDSDPPLKYFRGGGKCPHPPPLPDRDRSPWLQNSATLTNVIRILGWHVTCEESNLRIVVSADYEVKLHHILSNPEAGKGILSGITYIRCVEYGTLCYDTHEIPVRRKREREREREGWEREKGGRGHIVLTHM